ncbi:MAG: flagellar basal body L-ring protein FlgH [Comamonadaceae bacterium]|jgi:flagellar L-ring protein FlgH
MTPRFLSDCFAAGLSVLLASCAYIPPAPVSSVQQPLTARPTAGPIAPASNGAIYQLGNIGQAGYAAHPLFEDRRASAIGDVLTININETTAASKASGSTAARKTANDTSVTAVAGLPGAGLQGLKLNTSSSNTFDGKGDSASNNAFTGTITVTVIDVLANGNLVVSGEKQIGINQGSEFVRFSGVVSPSRIAPGNVVTSSQVADMRVEYRGNGYIDEAQTMGWFSRIFNSLNPF